MADDSSGLYTSELRGNDEAGEGTARVPFKTVLRCQLMFYMVHGVDVSEIST